MNSMRYFYLLSFFFLLSGNTLCAQQNENKDEKDPLSANAKQMMSYLITGENQLVSGLKIDFVESKASLSGVIPSRKGRHALNVSVGLDDGIFNVFSKNSINRQYSISYNYSIIPYNNKYIIHKFDTIWTKLRFITLSPFYDGQKYALYKNDISNRIQETIQSYGLDISFDLYRRLGFEKKKQLYFRLTGTLARGSNIEDFTKKDFIEIDSIFASSKKVIYAEKKGTAYQGNSLEYGFNYGLKGEIYFMPWEGGFAPGFYGRIGFRNSTILNKALIPTEIGLLFSIVSSDKKQNNITVLPHVRWQSVTKTGSDNFFIGVRLAVPVNIPNQ